MAGVSGLIYDDDQVYYIFNNTDIYLQNVVGGDKPVLVSSKFFTNANYLAVLDEFVYVTDSNLGLYVIKTYDD